MLDNFEMFSLTRYPLFETYTHSWNYFSNHQGSCCIWHVLRIQLLDVKNHFPLQLQKHYLYITNITSHLYWKREQY